ncbi:MAG: hypothetical protein K2X39_10185, partial [Silvanigrellaceae bacterium]|nr:hypothetical protein [Silvanigrellaceae bacterium]
GVKNMMGPGDEDTNITVTAKVPERSIYGYDIDARSLNQIVIHEDSNGEISDYSTTGWDDVTAKKLAASSESLFDNKNKKASVGGDNLTQKELMEQKKALDEEKARVLKSRDRLAEQEQNILRSMTPKDSPSSPTANNPQSSKTGRP